MRNLSIWMRFILLALSFAITIPLAVTCKSAAKRNGAKVQSAPGDGSSMEVAGSGMTEGPATSTECNALCVGVPDTIEEVSVFSLPVSLAAQR